MCQRARARLFVHVCVCMMCKCLSVSARAFTRHIYFTALVAVDHETVGFFLSQKRETAGTRRKKNYERVCRQRSSSSQRSPPDFARQSPPVVGEKERLLRSLQSLLDFLLCWRPVKFAPLETGFPQTAVTEVRSPKFGCDSTLGWQKTPSTTPLGLSAEQGFAEGGGGGGGGG